ncbi:hypothetical protein PIB30_036580 [Stylosanthes scabra]|uniref:Uncharacterized protein n=1 Tax=Stylosanthes scabra TaxID=79078 RepID=A0ABU6YC29_9FABA|nr:hypothetical protein [Stylosanthes scabra]
MVLSAPAPSLTTREFLPRPHFPLSPPLICNVRLVLWWTTGFLFVDASGQTFLLYADTLHVKRRWGRNIYRWNAPGTTTTKGFISEVDSPEDDECLYEME